MRRVPTVVVVSVVLVVALTVVLVRWIRAHDPTNLGSLRGVCDGDTRGSAPAYAGSPPHPIVIFMSDEDGDYHDPQFLAFDEVLEPGSLTARAWDPATTDTVQLVACGRLVDTEATDQTCEYHSFSTDGSSTSVPLDLTRYQVKVYEVRTHRQIGKTLTMEGREDTSCPGALDPDENPSRFLGEVSTDDLMTTLGRMVGNPQK